MSTTEKKEKSAADQLIDELFNKVLEVMEVKDLKAMSLQKIQEAETLEELTEATSYAAYTFIKKKELTKGSTPDTEGFAGVERIGGE